MPRAFSRPFSFPGKPRKQGDHDQGVEIDRSEGLQLRPNGFRPEIAHEISLFTHLQADSGLEEGKKRVCRRPQKRPIDPRHRGPEGH